MSEFAFFSDIHANLEALEAVLKDFRERGITQRYCLGDVVGYNPNPNEVIELLRSENIPCLLGNHDKGAVDEGTFNDEWAISGRAGVALAWTRLRLTPSSRTYLGELPYMRAVPSKPFTISLTHASPFKPEEWWYVTDDREIRKAFDSLPDRMINFHGHSHLPLVAIEDKSGAVRCFRHADLSRCGPVELDPATDNKILVNAGSIGQPRDGDNRACYCFFDPSECRIRFRRVAYDFRAVQTKIREVPYDDTGRIADRLALGE